MDVKHEQSLADFYLNSIKGHLSAEVFHGTACVYSLLEKQLAEYFKPYNLTPVKFNALMLIQHVGKEDGLSQNEISRLLIVSQSNITRLLDRLLHDGYIKRTLSESDRRVKIIKISKKGIMVLAQVWHGYGETIKRSANLLDEEEQRLLSSLLFKWFSRLEKKREGDAL